MAWAQAPGLLWTTNIGARVFAVDTQTNVYANAGGTVITLSPAGVPYQTNTICPVAASFAQRDVAGNFYFAGRFDGTQDFGGITLVGGWINSINYNPPRWVAGYPTCFLAKYDNAGGLLWAVSFGTQAYVNKGTDLMIAPDGSLVVGFVTGNGLYLRNYSASGSNRWERTVGPGIIGIPPNATPPGNVRVAKDDATNAYFLRQSGLSDLIGGWFDSDGNWFFFTSLSQLQWPGSDTNAKPAVCDGSGAALAGRRFVDGTFTFLLTKYLRSGGTEWTNTLPNTPWTLGGDSQGRLYVADTGGFLYEFDCAGTLMWNTNLGGLANSLLISQGTRFISFQNGAVARLGDDAAPQSPSILSGPRPRIVFVGDNFQLSASADGTPPLRYFWRLNGTNVAGATNSVLSVTNVTPSQGGTYTILVMNVAGSITSAPALVRVKSVQLYLGSQMLTNGSYVFATPPTLSVHSAFTSGSSFYTLDGSTPSFASTLYSGPFTLSQSATVRAIGYSADFFQSEEADAINAIVIVNHTLSASASDGGGVNLNPPGGTYASTNVVTATAVPAAGWSFMYWLGDVSGTNPSVSVSMERDKHIHAVFGTTLSTTVSGNGSIQLSPPGSFYPIGTVVRLTAVPQPGNYFGFWGNTATGNTNPLYFTITSPTQTVSSIFGATPADQASLTVLINGHGRVSVNPRANVYLTNQTATLTALPDTGESFLNWSGDASGTQNPLTVSMTQSKVITANFTSRPFLRANQPGLEGFTPEGFRLTLVSDPQSAYQILASTNLIAWEGVGTVTNFFGEMQFTDTNAVNFRSRFYKATP